MIWDKLIEFPDHPVTLRDVLDILVGCLDAVETESFAECLLAGLKGADTCLEPCDYENEV